MSNESYSKYQQLALDNGETKEDLLDELTNLIKSEVSLIKSFKKQVDRIKKSYENETLEKC